VKIFFIQSYKPDQLTKEIFERLRDLFEILKIKKLRRKITPQNLQKRYLNLKDKR